ncbi:MAG: ATP-binding cassette domain-containing protein [Turicibacter sp.]|nr:ATP-binding cassette domain-containing protein [Turicibacter sp.]
MLILKNVNKVFHDTHAVTDLNLNLQKGEIYGLLGANGAGKTTTFRMILGLYEQTSGEITWDGQKMNESINDLLGYLPEERALLQKLTVQRQVSYLAMLKGMNEDKIEKELDYWLKKFNITEYKNKKIKELSKGNQQKVQFICAVIHNPELIILDEPFTGLDPINLEIMKDEIINFKQKGKTIIFSSHRMEHIETLCDRLTILRKGKTVLQGNLKEIKHQYNARTILIHGKIEAKYLKTIPHVIDVTAQQDDWCVRIDDKQYISSIFNALKPEHKIEKFIVCEPSLHEIFIEKVGQAYEE